MQAEKYVESEKKVIGLLKLMYGTVWGGIKWGGMMGDDMGWDGAGQDIKVWNEMVLHGLLWVLEAV